MPLVGWLREAGGQCLRGRGGGAPKEGGGRTVMVRSKMMTASTMVKTCLTLAATAGAGGRWTRGSALGTVERQRSTRGQGSRPLTHRERARLFVGREADDVEAKGEHAVDEKRDELGPRHLGRAVLAHTLELAARPAEDDALNKGEGRHAHEEVERVQLEPAAATCLDQVGHDRLERGEEGPEQREDQTGERKVVVAVGPGRVGQCSGSVDACRTPAGTQGRLTQSQRRR
jgi:hypothetical protein